MLWQSEKARLKMISGIFPSIDFDRPIHWGPLMMIERNLTGQGWNQQIGTMSMNFLFIQRILWAPMLYLPCFLLFSYKFYLHQTYFIAQIFWFIFRGSILGYSFSFISFFTPYFQQGSLQLQCCNNFEPHLPCQLIFRWHKCGYINRVL